MGRNIEIDARRGGGAAHEILFGDVTIQATALHQDGTKTVFPDDTTIGISNGLAVLENVDVSPAGPEPAWAYKMTFRNHQTGRGWTEMVGVPAGSGPVKYPALTRFTTTLPPETTKAELQSWVATTEAAKNTAVQAAATATAPTDAMVAGKINDPASLTAGALSATTGIQLWKPMTNYGSNTRVIMPSGDVKVARTFVTGSAEPNLAQWMDMPQVARERLRTRTNSVRGLPSHVEEVAIPAAFLAKWNPGIKVFKDGTKYFTNWTADTERNTGGRNVYFSAAAQNGGNGGLRGVVSSGIVPFGNFTTITVSTVVTVIPAGTTLAVVHEGKLLTETLLVSTSEAPVGSTTINVSAATAPVVGIPAGAEVVRPIGSHLGNAYGVAADGDTIVILDKHVHRSNGFTTNPVTKSLNIESIHDQTTIANSEDVVWNPLTDNTFVSANNPVILTVVDMGIGTDGYEYERKDTAAEVSGNPGSWHQAFNASGPVTVCPFTAGIPDNTSLLLLSESPGMAVTGGTSDMRVYVKGIRFIGGSEGMKVTAAEAGVLTFVQDGCQFLWGGYGYRGSSGSNQVNTALRISGNVISLAFNSPVAHSGGDGRGYGGIDIYKPRALEVNSGGHSAGRTRAAERLGITTVQNISTMHDGGAVLRIGGDYSGSYGAVIADVHEGTVSLNLSVDAHDSVATGGYNNAFAAQQAGTKMWIFGCRAWGCTADILAVAGTTVQVTDTEFDTLSGSAYMDIINPR